MKTIPKSLLALLLGAGLLLTAALAQDTNIVVNTPATGVDATGIDLNLFTAMGSQFLKTPANLLLILAVSVIAWLWEITPSLNSRYVPHLCVLCATIGYPFLADRSAIPKSYPHPLMVMMLSGIIVGAISAAVHKPLMKKLGIIPPVVPVLLLSLGLFTGCKSPMATRLVAQQITYVGTRIALKEAPSSRPYLAEAAPLICAAANSGTNATPAAVVARLDTIQDKDDYGVLFLNSSLAIFFALYQADDPQAQNSLLGICDGLNLALAARLARPVGVPYLRR